MIIDSAGDDRHVIEQSIAQSELVALAKEFGENNTRLSELSMLTRDLTLDESDEKLRLIQRNHQIVIRQRQIMVQNGGVTVGASGVDED